MGKRTTPKSKDTKTVTVTTPQPTASQPMGVAAMAAAAEAADLRMDANGVSLRALAEVVGATDSDAGCMYLSNEFAPAMLQLGLIEQAPVEVVAAGPNGELATRVTDAGRAYFEAAKQAEQAAVQQPAPAPTWGAPPASAPRVLPDLTQQPAPQPAPQGAPKSRGFVAKTPANAVSKPVAVTNIPSIKRAFGERGPRASVYPFAETPVNSGFFVASTPENPKPWKSLSASCLAATKRLSKDGSKFIVRHLNDGGEVFGDSAKGKEGAGVFHVPASFFNE